MQRFAEGHFDGDEHVLLLLLLQRKTRPPCRHRPTPPNTLGCEDGEVVTLCCLRDNADILTCINLSVYALVRMNGFNLELSLTVSSLSNVTNVDL